MLAHLRHRALGAYASGGDALEANAARAQRVLIIIFGYALEFILIVGYARAGRNRMHPKFRLNARRARRLLAHVVLGSLELIFGAAAALSSNDGRANALMRMSAGCVLAHALTAIQQIGAAFGTPSIVTPALHIMNLAHLEKSFRVFFGSSDVILESFISQLVLAQGFAYSRIFIFAFTKVPGIKEHRYTTGATLALFLVIPAVYGPLGALLAMFLIAAYSNAYGSEESGKERDYNAVSKRASSVSLRRLVAKPLRAAFDVLDKNGDGTLDKGELREQLELWGVSEQMIEEFFVRVDTSRDGALSFAEISKDEAGRSLLGYVSDCLRDNVHVRTHQN